MKRWRYTSFFDQDLNITTHILKVGRIVWLMLLKVLVSSMSKIINNLFQLLKPCFFVLRNKQIDIRIINGGMSFYSNFLNIKLTSSSFAVLNLWYWVKHLKIEIHIILVGLQAQIHYRVFPIITQISVKAWKIT